MNGLLGRARQALTRKLGPLPVWAWAAIGGAAIYVYRTRRELATGSTGITPSVTDQTSGGQAPVVLQPGESAYDPNTGQLVGTAPSQAAPDQPQPFAPIVLDPGQQLYDPGTGQLVGGTPQGSTTQKAPTAKPKAPTNLSRAESRVSRGGGGKKTVATLLRAGFSRGQITHAQAKHTQLGTPKGKRAKTPKPQHKKGTPARQPTHSKGKGRVATVVSNVRTPKPQGSSAGRARGKPTSVQPTARQRAHVPAAPAVRQRPAAPRVVNHAAQRVEPHPARKAAPPAKKRKR